MDSKIQIQRRLDLIYVLKNKRYIQVTTTDQTITASTHINLRGATYFGGDAR